MNEISTKIENLPKEIQDDINSGNFFIRADEVGKKFDLHIDQVGELGSIVVSFVIGNIKNDDLDENIKKRLEVDDVLSTKILDEVNNHILIPLREKVIKSPNTTTPNIPITQGQANPEGLKPFAEPKTIPQPIIEPTVTHLGEKLETPDEILKHIEELPELPKPSPVQVQTPTTPTPISEPKPVENKVEKVPDQRKYTVDPYREPVE